MLRLFIAIPLEGENVQRIAQLRTKNMHVEDIHWTPELNLHITLFFIGDTKEENLAPVQEALVEACRTFEAFHLDFHTYEFRGKREKPSMIWARFKKSDAFFNVSKKLQSNLTFASSGSHHADPLPHCTLARMKKRIDTALVDLNSDPLHTVQVDRAELWQTTGVIYKRLLTVPFGS